MVCDVCGASVDGLGDICSTCRWEADWPLEPINTTIGPESWSSANGDTLERYRWRWNFIVGRKEVG